MKYKIGITANTDWFLYTFNYNLINVLATKYDIILLSPGGPYIKYFANSNAAIIHKDISIHSSSKSIFNNFQIFITYYKYYRNIRPDCVISFTIKPNIFSTIACVLLKIPTINQITGLGNVFIFESLSNKIIRRLYISIQRFASILIFQNIDDRNIFTGQFKNFPSRIESIPGPGVDLTRFQRKTQYVISKNFVFLFVGRIILDKGIIEFIEAAKIITSCYAKVEFHIIGQIDEAFHDSLSLSGLNLLIMHFDQIKYLGYIHDIKSNLEHCNCLVLPSYREGTGKVLLEAMAMELPVIASNVSGCNTLVKDGYNGLLFTSKNVNDLVQKMKHILSCDLSDLTAMGKNGRNFVSEFYDERIVIEKYESFLEDIVVKPRKGRNKLNGLNH